MAGLYGSAVSHISLGGGSRLEQLLLPNGACGYRDLNAGGRAPTCGCRRFWANNTTPVCQDNERAWCFCGHHACFHEASPVLAGGGQIQTLGTGIDAAPIQSAQYDTPRWRPDPQDAVPGAIGSHASNRYPGFESIAAPKPSGLGIRSSNGTQSIETRLWHALNGFARDQDRDDRSGDTSKLPSTAVPSVVDEPKASPSRMLRERMYQQNRPMAPPVNIPAGQVNMAGAEAYSATEVATPSIAGTPDFRAYAHPPAPNSFSPAHVFPGFMGDEHSPPRSNDVPTKPRNRDPLPHQAAPEVTEPNAIPLSLQEMYNTIQDQSRRIDILESLSFSHVRIEDVQEKFDMVDGRVLDLEHWRVDRDRADEDMEQEQEQEHEEDASSRQRHKLPMETDSFTSDMSDDDAAQQTATVVLATLAANAETHPRIDALASRISDLENTALPSFTRPWHVQVVLLPFGRQLPGIWFSSSESTEHSMRATTQTLDEWPTTRATFKSSFHSTTSGAWTTESIEAWANETREEWLSPKACGPTTTVFQRLASRGFVRDIAVTASDANHVFGQISNASKDINLGQELASSGSTVKYQGLHEHWIPLRKVRKSSRLRFLTPAEVVTSATWTAGFLESSVFMRVNDGQRRLYLTTPQAYLQPAMGSTLSWPKIRDLPMHDADAGLQAAQAAGAVVERCWTYNERLDHTTSLDASFASQDLWSTRSQSSAQGQEAAQDEASAALSASRPAHMRSLSLPSSASARENAVEALPKRRVASFETSAISSDLASPELLAKRRRISTSPELERRGVNFTPRWSREPPSPYTHDEPGMPASQAASHSKRGFTPGPYATPHSGLEYRGGDGDTEVDGGGDELEWEGVQDNPNADLPLFETDEQSHASQSNDEDDDDDEDEDEDEDLDDGLTIYEI